MHLPYTISYILHPHAPSVLLLLRRRPPNQNLWNGIGGKLKPGELPYHGALREIREETGLDLPLLQFAGVVSWHGAPETGKSGMYVYLARCPDSQLPVISRMAQTDHPEGMLAWCPLPAILNRQEPDLCPDIPCYLPGMLRLLDDPHAVPSEYHFAHDANTGGIRSFSVHDLSPEICEHASRRA